MQADEATEGCRYSPENYIITPVCYLALFAVTYEFKNKMIEPEMHIFQPTIVLESRLSAVRGSVSIAISASRALLILFSFLWHLQQHQMHKPKRKTEIIGTPITKNLNPVSSHQATPLSSPGSPSLFMMTGPRALVSILSKVDQSWCIWSSLEFALTRAWWPGSLRESGFWAWLTLGCPELSTQHTAHSTQHTLPLSILWEWLLGWIISYLNLRCESRPESTYLLQKQAVKAS
jgi:hypothetical protein